MSRKKCSLTRNEWLLMCALWDAQQPMSVSDVMQKMASDVSWSYSTYQTQLSRLVDSGYLTYEKKGRTRYFYPAVPMDACVLEEGQNIRNRMPQEASNQLLLCMLKETRSISESEADELCRLVEELRQRSSARGESAHGKEERR